MHNDVKEILIDEKEIQQRIIELGQQITQDYQGKRLILIGLLKGSIPFMAELMKYIDLDIEIEFMDVCSYSGIHSTEVRIEKDITLPVSDTHVLIVEDIVDTGKTLKVVRELLISRHALSVEIVTLLDKSEGRLVDVNVRYVGFNIPLAFVIGYGLDYNEKYRNLPYIGILKESCYE